MRLFIFLLLIPNFLIAQNVNEEIATLKDSIILFKNSNPDKSIFYGFEVIAIADFNNPTFDLVWRSKSSKMFQGSCPMKSP